jgi:hypothetical protein
MMLTDFFAHWFLGNAGGITLFSEKLGNGLRFITLLRDCKRSFAFYVVCP